MKGGEKKEEEEKTEREKAATRIQAAFRGHHARKSMKDIESSTKQTGTKSSSEPTKEQLQQEFRADDKGECHVPTLEIVPKGEPFNFTEISPFPANLVSRSSFVPSSRAKEFTTSLHSPLVCTSLWCLCASYVTSCARKRCTIFGAILCRIKLYRGHC